jgi:hypothetical protein
LAGQRTIRRGKIVRHEVWQSSAEALEAVGPSEKRDD